MSNLKEFNAIIRSQNTQAYLMDVLGEQKNEFVSNLTALVSNDKNLQQCAPLTLMYSALTATALKLPLDKNLGFAYVIPYNNRKAGTCEAQFQLGVKGYKQLAIRSGQFKVINATDVREGEMLERDFLTGDIKFKWDNTPERINKKIVGYVAFFELINSFKKTLYMSVEEVEAHAKRYSQTYASKTEYIRNSSKWTTDFDAMALKTVVKRLLSHDAPLSVDMSTALKADQSVQHNAGEYTYLDNGNDAKNRLTELAEQEIVEDAEVEVTEQNVNTETGEIFPDENN